VDMVRLGSSWDKSIFWDSLRDLAQS